MDQHIPSMSRIIASSFHLLPLRISSVVSSDYREQISHATPSAHLFARLHIYSGSPGQKCAKSVGLLKHVKRPGVRAALRSLS